MAVFVAAESQGINVNECLSDDATRDEDTETWPGDEGSRAGQGLSCGVSLSLPLGLLGCWPTVQNQ